MENCKKPEFRPRVAFSNTLSFISNIKANNAKNWDFEKRKYISISLVGFSIFQVLDRPLVGQKWPSCGTSIFHVQNRDYTSYRTSLSVQSQSWHAWWPPRNLRPGKGPVLRSRGVPLEHAAARVCREAGARVTMHTSLANLNIPAGQRADDGTIEVIANGCPLWHGSQLAIDTTSASPTPTGSGVEAVDPTFLIMYEHKGWVNTLIFCKKCMGTRG